MRAVDFACWLRSVARLVGFIASSSVLFVASSAAETLTVATYNIENYGPADRMTDIGFRKDYPKPEVEKRALRQVIGALHADIIVLQEMGSAPYVDELRHDLRAEGIDYPHTAIASAVDADRHVVLLSKRPLRSVATLTDLEFPYLGGKERVKRGLLQATVSTGAGDVTIFGLHLKSRFTDRVDDPQSAIRRAGEATAIRDAILRRFPNPKEGRFVIAGDCNDSRASKPLAHLQKRGATVIAEPLIAVDSRGENWTHNYRREETYSHVDFIFISPGLKAVASNASAQIFDGPGVGEASDHRPVVATLQFEPKR
jgi:endonuclease/exonuclease/phosphatase family metal-dependent hydrolase